MILNQLFENTKSVSEAVEDRTSYQVAKALFDYGVKYDPARENDLIKAIGLVLVKELNMSPRMAQGVMNDEDFLGDTLGELRHMEQGVAEGAKEDMSKEVKAMATGTCPHCHGPVKKKEHPTLTQYHCVKCGIRASQDKQGVAEGSRDRRDAYQRDYDSSVAGMGNRQSRAYRADGGGNDERHDLDPTDWYVVKDGKMFKVSVYPNQEQQAISMGYSRTRDEATAKAGKQGVAEVSSNTLKRYKKAAQIDIDTTDNAGLYTDSDIDRMGRRMRGIDRATSKINATKRKEQGVAEGSQQVDSLVTDALKIMRGADINDAITALKTVLGDREYNSRRGYYNFYVRQLMDMYNQQGVTEGFNGEYDDEAGMADNNLETLKRAVQGIDDVIQAGDNLPEWCQEKIAVSKSMLVSVWDYMRSEKDRK
jgi:hypothetical protein